MNSKEVRSAMDMIRDASKGDLIVVSLFLLPILLGSWSIFLNSIGYIDQHVDWKFGVLIVIAIVYVGGVIWWKWSDSKDDKLRRARLHVKNRLEHRGGNRASYMAIREEVNEGYTNEFLEELIDRYPETFYTVQIKRSGGQRLPGITLVKDELDDTQSTT